MTVTSLFQPSLLTPSNFDQKYFVRDPAPEPSVCVLRGGQAIVVMTFHSKRSFTCPGLVPKPASAVELFTEFVDPPEMPDAVKAEDLKGTSCYYGFYFPDSAVDAFDKAQAIECPPSVDPWSWKWLRKVAILQDATDALGIELFTQLSPAASTEASTNVDASDIVHFAYSSRYKPVSPYCLPVYKIKELMQILGIEGEPKWIPGW